LALGIVWMVKVKEKCTPNIFRPLYGLFFPLLLIMADFIPENSIFASKT